jgi:hypothetical protein
VIDVVVRPGVCGSVALSGAGGYQVVRHEW